MADRREEPRVDRRSRRTRRLLGTALLALLLEKRYDTITVQEIIDRANVGRSTFYAHYLDKDDLLQSESAELIARLSAHMDPGGAGRRIIPSLELLHHLRESQPLIRALRRGQVIEPVLKTMQAQLSREVADRLANRLPAGVVPTVPLPVVAQAVTGTLVTLFQWWLDREMPDSPEQVDAYFLQLVRPSVFATTGIEI